MGDATQIDQILINLAVNAHDAMPAGGTLSIETEMVTLDDEFIKIHGYGEPGKYVLLSVSDTGTGMDEATKARIFDPFFTTKEVGKGTGLGLSTVYGIVKQHNGYITVYSEHGHGTTFRIYLPVVDIEKEQKAPPVHNIKKGSETILIAEDDPGIRNFTREILQRYGYTIIDAMDGEEAVSIFMENRNRVDLIILDVVMPKKNGKEVYGEIIKTDPGMKFIFTSGYTGDIILTKGIHDDAFDFISKPLLPNELLKKIRDVLDR
jgi:CheY-like chemotaxis protein